MLYLSSIERSSDWSVISNSKKISLHKGAGELLCSVLGNNLKASWNETRNIWKRNTAKPTWAEMTERWKLFSLAEQRLERIFLLSINWLAKHQGKNRTIQAKGDCWHKKWFKYTLNIFKLEFRKSFPVTAVKLNRWKKDKKQRYFNG